MKKIRKEANNTMCNCEDVEFGTYANQASIKFPFYPLSSVDETVCVDNCILEEIKELWEKGIQTTNSCCGHNKLPGSIIVIHEHIDKMLELGYVQEGLPAKWHSTDGRILSSAFRIDIFLAKSVSPLIPYDSYHIVEEW